MALSLLPKERWYKPLFGRNLAFHKQQKICIVHGFFKILASQKLACAHKASVEHSSLHNLARDYGIFIVSVNCAQTMVPVGNYNTATSRFTNQKKW